MRDLSAAFTTLLSIYLFFFFDCIVCYVPAAATEETADDTSSDNPIIQGTLKSAAVGFQHSSWNPAHITNHARLLFDNVHELAILFTETWKNRWLSFQPIASHTARDRNIAMFHSFVVSEATGNFIAQVLYRGTAGVHGVFGKS